jgi:hypothetical protein
MPLSLPRKPPVSGGCRQTITVSRIIGMMLDTPEKRKFATKNYQMKQLVSFTDIIFLQHGGYSVYESKSENKVPCFIATK